MVWCCQKCGRWLDGVERPFLMDNKSRKTLEEECNSSVGNTFTFSRWKPSSVSVMPEDMTRGIDHTVRFLRFRLDIRKRKRH